MSPVAAAEEEGQAPIISHSVRRKPSQVIARHRKDQTRQRILIGLLVTGIVASIVFLVAMATTDWVRLTFPTGVYRRSSDAFVQRHVAGLFRLCRVELGNTSSPAIRREYCRMQLFFPSATVVEADNEIDFVILNYIRSGAAFAIIGFLLSAVASFFTWYTIREPRYMFKRVAGSLHLITAGCLLVCLEVFRNSLEYARTYLPGRFPADALLHYGASYGLAWASFGLYLLVGLALFILSAKRKGAKALSDKEARENEPVHLGRI